MQTSYQVPSLVYNAQRPIAYTQNQPTNQVPPLEYKHPNTQQQGNTNQPIIKNQVAPDQPKQDQRSTAPTLYQFGPMSHLGHLGSHLGPSGNDLGPIGNHLGPFGSHTS